ncbi:hypothetical protein [Rummeliibacillus pycnus]|uniref:hypothetical protein n=1 Tax=Rummeliibacillus pycnus TaxID=101070 RepID=UPI000C9B7821|nr:hypothetical protein [Rummeliibacillus pycnus]
MERYIATNERVQEYMNIKKTNKSKEELKANKNQRLEQIDANIRKTGKFFDEVYPKKQKAVLSQILYLTGNSGIWKIGIDELAKLAKVSRTTAKTVISKIKNDIETNEIIIGHLSCTHKYILVDMKHINFKDIMTTVFSLNDHQFDHQFGHQFGHPEGAENVDISSLNEEKSSLKGFKGFKSFKKQAIKNNNISISESEKMAIREEIENQEFESPEEQRKQLEHYATNKYQLRFYDFIQLMKEQYPKLVSDNAYKLSLRIGSDCTIERFYEAKNVLQRLVMDIHEGLQVDNIVATFTGALLKHESYPKIPKKEVAARHEPPKCVLYNWLDKAPKGVVKPSNESTSNNTKVAHKTDYEAKLKEIKAKLGM